jgi:ribosomal protein S27AE
LAYKLAWRVANPEKHRAHFTVANAIKRGDLVRQPCEGCGDGKAHAHHEDYQKPLEVRWLCARCHQVHHPVVRG